MTGTHKPRHALAGFTLIEVMVVVVIIAIITAFAVPSYRSMMTQNRMVGEINDLTTDLQLARSSAIKQGINVTICPSATPSATVPTCASSASWATGWIQFVDVAGNQIYNATNGDTLLRVHGPFSGTDTLTYSATASTTNGITFNRMGGTASFGTSTAYTNTGTLTLHDATNKAIWRRCVVISEAGTLTVNSPENQQQASCP